MPPKTFLVEGERLGWNNNESDQGLDTSRTSADVRKDIEQVHQNIAVQSGTLITGYVVPSLSDRSGPNVYIVADMPEEQS